MIVGIPRETFAGERRVAITPDAVPALIKAGYEIHVEAGAGLAAGFPDELYTQRGAKIVPDRKAAFEAPIVAQVRCPGANPEQGRADLALIRSGQILIGHSEPLIEHEINREVAGKGASLLAMELVPRTTRAQAMDALSSQANIAGYKAVLLAANTLPKILPMMMTAAGTLKAAKVFIVGVGVAGLQAIATAKRLGAIVSAIDVRPETKEQVESLGAKFIAPPETAKGEGGYAKEQTEEQKKRQQELMADTVAGSDVVITTAAIPGRRSPVLVTAAMVDRMAPGSVIVDLASERGGNCELTKSGEVIEHKGVTIIGTNNIPSTVPYHASAMYSGNILNLLKIMVNKEKQFKLDVKDDVIAGMLVAHEGQIVHPRVRDLMGLPALESADQPTGGAK